MTQAIKRQLTNRLNRTLDDLKDWKFLQAHKKYDVFNAETVALRIIEKEQEADEITDMLIDGGYENVAV